MSDVFYTKRKAIEMTGLSTGAIDKLLFAGKIGDDEGHITQADMDAMMHERETYISLLEYARLHTSDRFDGESTYDRNKLYEYIESNDRFGIEVTSSESLLTGSQRDKVFYLRKDIPVLDESLHDYFVFYGRPLDDQLGAIIRKAKGHAVTKKYLEKYKDLFMFEQNISESYINFVKIIMDIPDVTELDDRDLRPVWKMKMSDRTRNHIIAFLAFVRSREHVNYGAYYKEKAESTSIPAYNDDTYLGLVLCIFNAEYIDQEHMIEKAMANHTYAEMWLFHALHFCCGWRAQDICNAWCYLHLNEHEPGFLGVNADTLYEDIMLDRIPDEVYEDVCAYSIGSLDASGAIAKKTAGSNEYKLTAVITKGLYTFFGLLLLIAESHMIRSGEGYMQAFRTDQYSNKVNLRQFYGETITTILNGENLLSRRLNKDYLQGIEKTAREQGVGGFMTSALASFARNHTDLGTIKAYLRDHNLTGETASVVIHNMMDRGVFGWELYQTLITAFPDEFAKLTMAEQTEVIKQMNITPFHLELNMSSIRSSLNIKEDFLNGRENNVLEMLKAMYEIGQNRGKAKDEGVHCIRRARGEICKDPLCESCIASCCDELVFTRYGYKALLSVLFEYQEAKKAGNMKAYGILEQVLMPRYRRIINQLMKDLDMSQEERNGLKLMMKEALDG